MCVLLRGHGRKKKGGAFSALIDRAVISPPLDRPSRPRKGRGILQPLLEKKRLICPLLASKENRRSQRFRSLARRRTGVNFFARSLPLAARSLSSARKGKEQESTFLRSLSIPIARQRSLSSALARRGTPTKKLTLLLQHLGGDRHGRVDGVRDDVEQRARARVGAGRDQVAHNARVDLEQVVAGHPWLARHSRGDDDEVAALQGVVKLVGAGVSSDDGLGVDVGEVGGDSRGACDVVERELGDEGVDLMSFFEFF